MKNIKRNKEYEPEILQKLHTLQLEMLSDLQKICEKYNLEYFAVLEQRSELSDIRDLFRGMMILMLEC